MSIGPADVQAGGSHVRTMPAPIDKSSSEAPSVFIIDDDDGLRVGLDALFRSVGYRTHQFGSAAAFMESGFTGNAGCLVLDVRLPGLSGLVPILSR